MTGLCGATGDTESGVTSAIEMMLKAMWRRGSDTRSFISGNSRTYLGIGFCEWPTQSSKTDFRFRQRLTLATDGFFYEDEMEVRRTVDGPPGSLAKLLTVPGAFSLVASLDNRLFGARDPVGQKPLYYGTYNQGQAAFASLRTALKRIGTIDVVPVPPGMVLAASGKIDGSLGTDHRLSELPEKRVTESKAVAEIGNLLHKAVSTRVPRESGVAFSGGLDSSLVASACKRSDKGPELITVGVKAQPELEHAHRVALEMGLPITIHELSPSEILDSLPEVVAMVESADPVVVGVSVPFYFACRKAREIGLDTIVAGQMSDELFGGYARFEELAVKAQADRFRSEIMESVHDAPANDFEPGDKVAVSLGLEMRCPFAYLPLVEYALRLPLSMKIRISPNGAVRKFILRRLAAGWNLPETVVNRPKRAVQYSSGVQKVLEREAKRRKLSLRRMLESLLPEAN